MESTNVGDTYAEDRSSNGAEGNRSMDTCRGSSLCSQLSSNGHGEDVHAQRSDRLAVTSSSSSDTTFADDEGDAPVSRRALRSRVGKAGSAADVAAGPSPADADDDEEAEIVPTAVGLINEGCTCYLNSLLQLLFHISYFRTAVYRIPVEDDDEPSVYKALQETFFQMQERTTPARTTVLTNAFGWGRKELYVQHDIQEMATLLRDNLEERMKGTVTEGAINQLFEGRGEQFVETLDKSYVSRRADTYYDVHIPLGQHSTLLGSLTSLTARDKLVGENKYRVEREGMPVVYMDAEKGYSYTRFPAVTWFHLKRFAMDLTSPTLEMRKVNTPLEFPVVLDLRSLEKPDAAAASDDGGGGVGGGSRLGSAVVPFSSDSLAIYDLQGVIVHRGTARSGHYYCYIREWDPVGQRFCRWLEYDDENVRQVPEDVAVRANYGRGTGSADSFRHDTSLMGGANAYILSYVRRADAAAILAPSPTDIVSDWVKEAMRRAIQEEERQLREAEEARLSVTMYCITDAALSKYCDSVCSTELFSRDTQQWRRLVDCVITVRKSDTLAAVYEALAAQPEMARRGVTASNCRLWRCSDGSALRPSIALPTYAENAEHNELAPQQPQECLRDFLTAEENNTALTMCLYVDQAKVPLPGLHGVTKEWGLIRSIQQDDTGRCYTVELSSPTEAKALHITLDHSEYAATVEYVVTTDTETLPVAMAAVTDSCNTVTLLLSESRRTVSVMLTCYMPNKRTVAVRNVHLELPFGHPLLHPAPAASTAALPVLPLVGYDRALIFFKYYDYSVNTIQYVGSRLIDKAAKTYCCGAVYRDFLGLLDDAAPSSSGAPVARSQPPPPSMFRFFLERGDHTPVELNEHLDLGDFKSGCVVVAQLRAIPASCRYLSILNYYRDTRNSLDVHIIEVERSHRANDDAYRQSTLERQRGAVAAATASSGVAKKERTSTGGATDAGPTAPPLHSAAPGGESEGATDASTTGAPPQGDSTALINSSESVTSDAKKPTTPSTGSTGDGAVTANTSTTCGATSSVSPTPALTMGTTRSSATAVANAAVEADPIRIAATLNPYEAVQLSTLHEISVATLPTEHSCRMLFSWNYEAVCTAIGRTIAFDPNRLQLYQCCSTGEPAPEVSPTPYSSRLTVADLLYLDSYNKTSVLYYERLAEAREQHQSVGVVTATLRDHAGHALHREAYSVNLASITRQGLVRRICESVPAWQREADVWGTMQDTLQSPHFTLSFVDSARHVIAAMHEVAMSKTGAEESALEASALRKFEVDIQAAAPLQGTEQRIACCHMNYSTHDRSTSLGQQQQRSAFGQPFLITIDRTTTVHEALDIMLQTTYLPKDALNNAEGFGVMMVAGQVYHFENWEEHVHLFWVHTKNTSQYVASLMLNHAKPREKPGSRYVAQHSPQLKISNK
ncbi:cysteine peptidase, Clan CA, family C19,putative [Leishmania mexicana MHOM/GT/2001/U1103]|uniref:Ubiquitin hydrolase n=1 Tax=Leishmania mexicana (strain MHOM/GT/2001/U1103) TaxID=929439 RepID=E9AQC2_LEIMU|nr:cysteine peptidase, Clan CA, family C19,putative [Leishmania mexicana MHOM/GT/2001/U1103]CBZ25141.1 cysteine peptidase, Clan CA, family C19,putative [Leishmania mexicana MHOM/GT/2001/U1103]